MAQIFDSELGSSIRIKLNNTGLRRNKFGAGRAPNANDDSADGYEPGSLWTNDSSAYMLIDATVGSAFWNPIGTTGVISVNSDLTALGARIDSNATDINELNARVQIQRIVRTGSFTIGDSDIADGSRMFIMAGLSDSATVTVPTSLTNNEYCTVFNRTNTRVSFAETGGSEVISPLNKKALVRRGASAVLFKDSSDSFFLVGDLDS